MSQNIYLTGFMGAGKTSVGLPLAHALSLPFIDLDDEIVAREGRSIPDIFAQDGQAAFRAIETQTLCSLKGPAVISLGGGAITTPALREYVGQHGVTVFLKWPLDVLIARISGDPNRPLAQDLDALKALYEARIDLYLQAHLVWASQPPHQEAVSDIVAWIEQHLSVRKDASDHS